MVIHSLQTKSSTLQNWKQNMKIVYQNQHNGSACISCCCTTPQLCNAAYPIIAIWHFQWKVILVDLTVVIHVASILCFEFHELWTWGPVVTILKAGQAAFGDLMVVDESLPSCALSCTSLNLRAVWNNLNSWTGCRNIFVSPNCVLLNKTCTRTLWNSFAGRQTHTGLAARIC